MQTPRSSIKRYRTKDKGHLKPKKTTSPPSVPMADLISFHIRPFDLRRDAQRVRDYHQEIALLQNSLWLSLSSLTVDSAEIRRQLQTRQEGNQWVRQLTTMLTRGECNVLMLDAPGGQPAGYAFITESFDPLTFDRMGIIGEVYIASDFRRKGAGMQLLRAAESWFVGRSIKNIQVFVTRTNDAAVALYQKAGYTVFDYRMVKPAARD